MMSGTVKGPAVAPGQCACPGCPNESFGPDSAYCAACEEEAHIAHCVRCRAAVFFLDRPCPACGEPVNP
jgi:hypothetical protein